MVGFDVDDMFPPELMRVTAASDIQRLQAEGEREWSKSSTQLEIEARESRAERARLSLSEPARRSEAEEALLDTDDLELQQRQPQLAQPGDGGISREARQVGKAAMVGAGVGVVVEMGVASTAAIGGGVGVGAVEAVVGAETLGLAAGGGVTLGTLCLAGGVLMVVAASLTLGVIQWRKRRQGVAQPLTVTQTDSPIAAAAS